MTEVKEGNTFLSHVNDHRLSATLVKLNVLPYLVNTPFHLLLCSTLSDAETLKTVSGFRSRFLKQNQKFSHISFQDDVIT